MAQRKRSHHHRRPRADTGVDGRHVPRKLVTLGAHRYDPVIGRCHYCGWTREMMDDNPGRCVMTNWRALEAMGNRTPLRLTSEDEQIMREDWGLDPHHLPAVRIYQDLLTAQRRCATLQQQVNDRDERLRELEKDSALDRVLGTAGKPEAPTARIRRVSRPAEAPWDPSNPGEVLLLKEVRGGVEYAFIAADEMAADWALHAGPRDTGLFFDWAMNQTIGTERAP